MLLSADQSGCGDRFSGKHAGRPSPKEARHHQGQGSTWVGTEDQVARWPSSHGGRFQDETRSPKKQLNRASYLKLVKLLRSAPPHHQHFFWGPMKLLSFQKINGIFRFCSTCHMNQLGYLVCVPIEMLYFRIKSFWLLGLLLLLLDDEVYMLISNYPLVRLIRRKEN